MQTLACCEKEDPAFQSLDETAQEAMYAELEEMRVLLDWLASDQDGLETSDANGLASDIWQTVDEIRSVLDQDGISYSDVAQYVGKADEYQATYYSLAPDESGPLFLENMSFVNQTNGWISVYVWYTGGTGTSGGEYITDMTMDLYNECEDPKECFVMNSWEYAIDGPLLFKELSPYVLEQVGSDDVYTNFENGGLEAM